MSQLSVAQCSLEVPAMRSGQAGFTLGEILTTVVLTGLLATIAVPNLSALAARHQLDGATQELAFDLGRARMKAVGENLFCRVRMGNTSGGAVYWLETSEDGVAYATDGPIKHLPDGIRFESLPSVLPQFNRLGLTPALSSISLINGRNQAKLITVNTVGKIDIESSPTFPEGV